MTLGSIFLVRRSCIYIEAIFNPLGAAGVFQPFADAIFIKMLIYGTSRSTALTKTSGKPLKTAVFTRALRG